MSDFELKQFNREAWLAAKLHLADYDAGVTTADQRRETIRQAIIDRGIADQIIGRSAGLGPLTYAQVFRQLYGQPLLTDELHFDSEPDTTA